MPYPAKDINRKVASFGRVEYDGGMKRKFRMDPAVAWLRELLAGGSMPAAEIAARASAAGISKRTLDRAKAALGVVSTKRGNGAGGRWLWLLPPGSEHASIVDDVAPAGVHQDREQGQQEDG